MEAAPGPPLYHTTTGLFAASSSAVEEDVVEELLAAGVGGGAAGREARPDAGHERLRGPPGERLDLWRGAKRETKSDGVL